VQGRVGISVVFDWGRGMTDDLTPPHWGSAEIEDQMTDDELRGWLSTGPCRRITINSNTPLNAICNAALTTRATPPLSAALKLPEVAALVEALRETAAILQSAVVAGKLRGSDSYRIGGVYLQTITDALDSADAALDAAKGGK